MIRRSRIVVCRIVVESVFSALRQYQFLPPDVILITEPHVFCFTVVMFTTKHSLFGR